MVRVRLDSTRGLLQNDLPSACLGWFVLPLVKEVLDGPEKSTIRLREIRG